MADGPFFISYSRRDYYFAESLALHLMRRGVPVWLDVKDLDPGGLWEQDLDAALDRASAVILVVSPDSMKTVNVRKEWVRARDRGKRIVIAYFRRAQLPPELADCEAVDFRGSFMPSLDDLVSLLSRPSTASPHHGLPYPALPRFPLTVLLLLVTLAVPTAGYFLLANWSFPANQSTFENILTIAVIPIGLALMVWFFCVSLLSRRMGMTRLATCLVLLGTFYVLPLAMSWFGSSLITYDLEVVQYVSEHWYRMMLLASTPFVGLILLLIIRPADLLRWTPTGRAWDWYRTTCAGRAGIGFDIPMALKGIRTFRLQCDQADRPAAERLGVELRAMGAHDTAESGEGSTVVLLLTGRTRIDWLTKEIRHLPPDVRLVVGTAIRLPEQLDWLWKHQWIDFRQWDVSRLARQKLPQIPEAVTRVRFPFTVRVIHHLMCSFIGLLIVAVGLANPEGQESAAFEIVPALGVWVGLVWLARAASCAGTFRRRRPSAGYAP